MTLEKYWSRCIDELGGSLPPPFVWNELTARYQEAHRAYHTFQHLDECFGWFQQSYDLAASPGELAFALFYHDAVYDPRASDNELRSAELAVSVLEEYVRGDSNCARIHELILMTRHDAIAVDPDAALLVDIDLAILGAAPARFDEYETQVRMEYAWVSDEAFREGRSKILKSFRERPAIYRTPYFFERLETPARANLARSIDRLSLAEN